MAKKILIVEDNAQDRKIIRLHLMRLGYDLVFASTGEEGIVKAKFEKPDLIILDINLPKMSGVEVHLTLKDYPATRHIPIIFNTKLLAAGDIGEGMERFIAKSSPMEDLGKTIHTILGNP